MPHYSNGRAAKLDDVVIVEPKSSVHTIGIVIAISANSTSCNATILPLARKYSADGRFHPVTQSYPDGCISLSDCRPLLPAEAALSA